MRIDDPRITRSQPDLDAPQVSPPVLALLEDGGVSVDFPDRLTDSQIRRHSSTIFDRADLMRSLPLINTTTKGARRFLECGARARVQYDPRSGAYRMVSRTCQHRWCPACRAAFTRDLNDRIMHTMRGAKKFDLKFITLTLRSEAIPLGQSVTKIWTAFRRLRQTTLWQRRIKFGVAILEITYNERTQLFHPHIHIIANGGFMPRKSLSKCWEKATKGSMVSDIRAVKKPGQAVAYLLKYVSKGVAQLPVENRDTLLAEVINGLKRKKTVLWFGRRVEVEEDQDTPLKEEVANTWIDVCSFDHLMNSARKGNAQAKNILTALDDGSRKHPLWSP